MLKEISVKEKDLLVAMKAMLYLLKEKLAFMKHPTLMALLEDLGCVSAAAERARNANLQSQRMQDEILRTLGMHIVRR